MRRSAACCAWVHCQFPGRGHVASVFSLTGKWSVLTIVASSFLRAQIQRGSIAKWRPWSMLLVAIQSWRRCCRQDQMTPSRARTAVVPGKPSPLRFAECARASDGCLQVGVRRSVSRKGRLESRIVVVPSRAERARRHVKPHQMALLSLMISLAILAWMRIGGLVAYAPGTVSPNEMQNIYLSRILSCGGASAALQVFAMCLIAKSRRSK